MAVSRPWLALILTLGFVAVTGCETRVVNTSLGGLGRRADPRDAEPEFSLWNIFKSNKQVQWTIVLHQYSGAQRRVEGEQSAEFLRQQTGMKDIYISDDGAVALVCYGRYDSPQTREARRDLHLWHQIRQTRGLRLTTLNLAPLSQNAGDPIREHDLRAMRNKGKYTLQIGFYEDRDQREHAKTSAEKRVEELRKQGLEAYYYHGLHRSLVTVGIFGERAVLSRTQNGQIFNEYSPEVQALQKLFPKNLENNKPIPYRADDGSDLQNSTGASVHQPSFLVRIPGPTGER